jgi:hypothetical protein
MMKWPITTERYLAIIDTIGFRDQLEGRSLEQMYRVMMMFHEWARLAANQAKGKITCVSWPETSL